jgi:hypothetical protein
LSSLTIFSVSPARADLIREIDVVAITWPNAPTLENSVPQLRAVIDNYTIGYWERQAQIQFVNGLTDTDLIQMSSEAPCMGDATVDYMNQVSSKFYAKHKLNGASRYLIVLMPKLTGNCVWAAKSFVGDYHTTFGMTILQDAIQPNVITHELGHSLGLGHTNLMSCPNSVDGDWGSCQNIEYAGAIDMMSNFSIQGPLNIYDKWRIHSVDSINIASVQNSGAYQLYPSNSDGQVQGLYIRDGRAVYWIEFRLTADGYKKGLAIYRTDTPLSSTKSVSPNSEYTGKYMDDQSGDVWLLNLGDFQYSNQLAGSPTGWKFDNYTGNISITAEDSGPFAAVNVQIKPGTITGTLPTNPTDLTKYTFNERDLGGGFVVSSVVNGKSLNDPTLQICNGKFLSESHRETRSQVAATPISSTSTYAKKYLFISTEAVEYETTNWAGRTLNELDTAVSKCDKKTAQIKKIIYFTPKNVKARSFLVITKSKGTAQYLYATFQVKSNIMLGTYVISKSELKTNELNKWLQISQKLGIRM